MKTKTCSRWMIVDDQEDTNWLIQHMLSIIVPEVEIVAFNSPKAALRAFAQDPNGFDLVITDFNMPGLNGNQLREQLRLINPAVKVVLSTASFDWNFTDAQNAGFDSFLQKPFSICDLRDTTLNLTCEPLCLQAA
ncbi:MAG: response regulator [Limisphaerales bacterium]